MELVWNSIRTVSITPEALYTCPTCKKQSSLHPNYLAAGISGCAGVGRCFSMEEISKQMVKCRNFIFLKLNTEGRRPLVEFKKTLETDHVCSVTYETMRKGGDCKICIDKNKICKNTSQKIIRPQCGCKSKHPGCLKKVCSHYNYEIICPEKAKEWNYELNGEIIPSKIAPGTQKSYWHKCQNSWCKMSYLQAIKDRVIKNTSCPFCAGSKACHWNNLKVNYPELCGEIDSENNVINPEEITYGSKKLLSWICNKHDPPYKYQAPARDRIAGHGCRQCNDPGFAQRTGGHDHFVQEAKKVHGNKYEYREMYKGNQISINIWCSIIGTNGQIHGNFLQQPSCHKQGQGCPKCFDEQTESKGIRILQQTLDDMGYIMGVNCFSEHIFEGLKYIKPLRVDRWLPDDKSIIEYDGEYHFKVPEDRGGFESLCKNKMRDILKDKFCLEKGYNMIRIPYTITPTKELIEQILMSCKKNQTYITYQEYFEEVGLLVDLSKITVIIVDTPNI